MRVVLLLLLLFAGIKAQCIPPVKCFLGYTGTECGCRIEDTPCPIEPRILYNQMTCEAFRRACNPGETAVANNELRCIHVSKRNHFPLAKSAFLEKELSENYCSSGITGAKSDAAYYRTDRLYFCWLEDCGQRNYILVAYRPPSISDGLPKLWCHPPVQNIFSPIKYCPLYADESRIVAHNPKVHGYDWNAWRNFKQRAQAEGKIFCALPPICDKNGTVERTKFMPPFLANKVNNTYCERMCPLNEWPWIDCIPYHPKGFRNRLTTLPPDYHREICTDPYETFSKWSSNGCIRVPVCNLLRMPPKGPENPYGFKEDELRCVSPVSCDETHLPKDYDCYQPDLSRIAELEQFDPDIAEMIVDLMLLVPIFRRASFELSSNMTPETEEFLYMIKEMNDTFMGVMYFQMLLGLFFCFLGFKNLIELIYFLEEYFRMYHYFQRLVKYAQEIPGLSVSYLAKRNGARTTFKKIKELIERRQFISRKVDWRYWVSLRIGHYHERHVITYERSWIRKLYQAWTGFAAKRWGGWFEAERVRLEEIEQRERARRIRSVKNKPKFRNPHSIQRKGEGKEQRTIKLVIKKKESPRVLDKKAQERKEKQLECIGHILTKDIAETPKYKRLDDLLNFLKKTNKKNKK